MYSLIMYAIVGFVCLVGGGYLGYRWGRSVEAEMYSAIAEMEKLGGKK
jgi:hypothetical protein